MGAINADEHYVRIDIRWPRISWRTQYAWDGRCSFGYIETTRYPADAADCVELEVGEDKFADDKHYTKQEVDDILHPILYNEPICYNPFNNLK